MLGNLGDTCVLTWRANVGSMGRLQHVFALGEIEHRKDIGLMVILDFGEIECQPMKWHSLLSLYMASGKDDSTVRVAILGLATGPPAKLMAVVAAEAFWDMDIHMLQRAAKIFNLSVGDLSIFNTLQELVNRILILPERSLALAGYLEQAGLGGDAVCVRLHRC